METQLYVVEARVAHVGGDECVIAVLNRRPDPAWSSEFVDAAATMGDAGSCTLSGDELVLTSASVTADEVVRRVNASVLRRPAC